MGQDNFVTTRLKSGLYAARSAVLERAKQAYFGDEMPYEFLDLDISQPQDVAVDHLLDYRSQGVEIDPEMHVLVDVKLRNGELSDILTMHSVVQFQNQGNPRYLLWDADRTRSIFNGSAEFVGIERPDLVYFFMGFDWLAYLKSHEKGFTDLSRFDLKVQKKAPPNRGFDFLQLQN